MLHHPFKIFVCSYVVSGQLLNLELTFPERPLLSEIRARTVNAFRAEEAAIIDRSQSIAFDVALLFIFDGALQRWRPMQSAGSGGDIVEGCQIYAQPRISSSVIRSICDNSDAIEMQRIPAPIKGRLTEQQQQHFARQQQEIMEQQQQELLLQQQQQSSTSSFSRNYLGPVPQQQQQQQHSMRRNPQVPQQNHRAEHQIVLSSDDDDDDNHSPSSRRRKHHFDSKSTSYSGTDLALAESWDEACRTLFGFLDDDHDGLVDIGEIPDTLERIATQSTSASNNISNNKNNVEFLQRKSIPESFPDLQGSPSRRHSSSSSLVDETSFVAFCCKHENTGIVSGLLAFIHSCNKARQDVEQHQKLLDRIHKGLFPNRRGAVNESSSNIQRQQQQMLEFNNNNDNNYGVNILHSPPPEFLQQQQQQQSLMYSSNSNSSSSATPLTWAPNNNNYNVPRYGMMMPSPLHQHQQQFQSSSSPLSQLQQQMQQQHQQQFNGFYGQYTNQQQPSSSSPFYPHNTYRNVGFQ